MRDINWIDNWKEYVNFGISLILWGAAQAATILLVTWGANKTITWKEIFVYVMPGLIGIARSRFLPSPTDKVIAAKVRNGEPFTDRRR